MRLNEYLEREIAAFLDRKMAPVANKVLQLRPEEVNIFYLQKDYSKDIGASLAHHDLITVKMLFNELCDIYNKVSNNSPEKRKALSILREVFGKIKKYLLSTNKSMDEFSDIFNEEVLHIMEGNDLPDRIETPSKAPTTLTVSSAHAARTAPGVTSNIAGPIVMESPLAFTVPKVDLYPSTMQIHVDPSAVQKEVLELVRDMRKEMRLDEPAPLAEMQAPVSEEPAMPVTPPPARRGVPIADKPTLSASASLSKLPAPLDDVSELSRERAQLQQQAGLVRQQTVRLLSQVQEDSRLTLQQEIQQHVDRMERERSRKERMEALRKKSFMERQRIEEQQELLALQKTLQAKLASIENDLKTAQYAHAEKTLRDVHVLLIRLPFADRTAYREHIQVLAEKLTTLRRFSRTLPVRAPATQQINELYKLGLYHFHREAYNTAITIFTDILNQQPNNVAARIRLEEATRKKIAV